MRTWYQHYEVPQFNLMTMLNVGLSFKRMDRFCGTVWFELADLLPSLDELSAHHKYK